MRRDNAREYTGSVGATDTGQLLQDQGWDIMSCLVRVTCLCVVRPNQHRSRGRGGRRLLSRRSCCCGRGGRRARRLVCGLACWRENPRERSNSTREWNGGSSRQWMDVDVSQRAGRGSLSCYTGRARRRAAAAATCTDVRWQGLPWASGMNEGRPALLRSLLAAF